MVYLPDYKKVKGFIIIFIGKRGPYFEVNDDRFNWLDAKYKSKGYLKFGASKRSHFFIVTKKEMNNESGIYWDDR